MHFLFRIIIVLGAAATGLFAWTGQLEDIRAVINDTPATQALSVTTLFLLVVAWLQAERVSKWKRRSSDLKEKRVELAEAGQATTLIRKLIEHASSYPEDLDLVVRDVGREANKIIAKLQAHRSALEDTEFKNRILSTLNAQKEALGMISEVRDLSERACVQEVMSLDNKIHEELESIEYHDGEHIGDAIKNAETSVIDFRERLEVIKGAKEKLSALQAQLEILEKALEALSDGDLGDVGDLIDEVFEKLEELGESLDEFEEGSSSVDGNLADQLDSIRDARNELADRVIQLADSLRAFTDDADKLRQTLAPRA